MTVILTHSLNFFSSVMSVNRSVKWIQEQVQLITTQNYIFSYGFFMIISKTNLIDEFSAVSVYENLYFSNNSFVEIDDIRHGSSIFAEKNNGLYRSYGSTKFSDVDSVPFKEVVLNRGVTLFLLEPPQCGRYLGHYYHVVEHIIGIVKMMRKNKIESSDVKNIIILGDGFEPRDPYSDPISDLYFSLFPNSYSKDSKTFLKKCKKKTHVFERAIVSDRGKTQVDKECKKYNKHLTHFLSEVNENDIEYISSAVRKYYVELEEYNTMKRSNKEKVIYVARRGDRKLEKKAEKRLLKYLIKNGVYVEKVYFEDMNPAKQFDIAYNATCMIGVHGNGLTHCIFMRPGSKVIELFPKDCYMHDYEFLCRMKSIMHYPLDPMGNFIKGLHKGHDVVNEEVSDVNEEKILKLVTC